MEGNVDFSRSKKLPIERAQLFKKGIAKSGDLLFAHNATVGPTAILRTKLDYVILSTTVTYFRFDNSRYDTIFAYQAFNSDKFIRQYSRVMFHQSSLYSSSKLTNKKKKESLNCLHFVYKHLKFTN